MSAAQDLKGYLNKTFKVKKASIVVWMHPRAAVAVALKPNPWHRVQVTLIDGRMFSGEFQALDKQGNIVMGKAVEYMGADKSQERPVGMILVPKSQRQKVEVKVALDEALAGLNVAR